MKYILMALVFVGCANPHRPEVSYEITCPVNMITTKVDTITGYDYVYYRSSLAIYTGPDNNIKWREYPMTCVVSTINDGE